MGLNVILTGDINLLGVTDPALPFRRVADTFRAADAVFGNLECCLFESPQKRTIMADDVSGYEGFLAAPEAGKVLTLAGYHAVGNANNQNYGADAILGSNACLDELGMPHAGTGENRAAARAPVVVNRNGVRFGFMQRTSQYWPNNHEALEHSAGVAVVKAYTAYQPPYYKDNLIPSNRPGAPAKIVTWCDSAHLALLKDDVAALRQQSDIVISSHHWGYAQDILEYQTEIAHAAIDAGADIVMGHGPHFPLAMEIYKGKPIFYGLGSFCFLQGNKKRHTNWVGMAARVVVENHAIARVAFSLVRQADNGEIAWRKISDETEEVARLERQSKTFGTSMTMGVDEVVLTGAN